MSQRVMDGAEITLMNKSKLFNLFSRLFLILSFCLSFMGQVYAAEEAAPTVKDLAKI